jgi:hypothetical protein
MEGRGVKEEKGNGMGGGEEWWGKGGGWGGGEPRARRGSKSKAKGGGGGRTTDLYMAALRAFTVPALMLGRGGSCAPGGRMLSRLRAAVLGRQIASERRCGRHTNGSGSSEPETARREAPESYSTCHNGATTDYSTCHSGATADYSTCESTGCSTGCSNHCSAGISGTRRTAREAGAGGRAAADRGVPYSPEGRCPP